jgi:enoyl-[acyl-carrier-protein] reductase (NADH)
VIKAKSDVLGVTEEEFKQELLSSVSLHKMVTAQDIANMALFLATPAGASISGQALSVCGNVEYMR